MSEFAEKPIIFECRDETLLGILHSGLGPYSKRIGLMIVVGGPQYRVGSHRQFLLLARDVARSGFPVFRFDLRGMGDSTGSQISFEQSGPDIDGAIEAFLSSQPQLDGVVLWGLCDAASSILMHGVTNRNVCGIILLNPWVRSDATIASARLNKYYGQRLLSRSFWKKLLSGKVDISDSIKGLVSDLRKRTRPQTHDDAFGTDFGKSPNGLTGFRFKMLAGLNRFSGPILIILSGADLTAGEFVEISKAQNGWKEALEKPGVTIRFLDNADHTFSTALWRNRVEAWTREWLEAFESSAQKPSKPVVGNGTFSS